MSIILREDQVIGLFKFNLFDVVDKELDFSDLIFERKFSFGEKYRVGLCVGENKIQNAISEVYKENPSIDKIIVSGLSRESSEFKWLCDNVENFGSKIELFTKRNFFDLEKKSNWEIDFRREIKSGNSKGGSYLNLVKEVSDKIAFLILEDEENLWNIEWREFEKLIHNLFHELGFEVELTPPSGDGGKDIVCKIRDSNKVYYIELKLHKTPIGNTPIKKMKDLIKNDSKANSGFEYKGLVISPRGFSKKVKVVHELGKDVIIGDIRKVVSLCKRYVQVKSGFYLPNQDFKNLIKEDTIG